MELRTFLAIDLPPSLHSILERTVNQLKREMTGIAWVHQKNLHVTVKFFGDTTEAQIAEIRQVGEQALTQFSPFELDLRGVGFFPDTRSPRILWAGIAGDVEALTGLVRHVEQAMVPVGFPWEDKPFRPHLTMARIKKDHRKVGEAIGASGIVSDPLCVGRFHVKRVTLFQSDLRPSGSVYTKLGNLALAESRNGVR